MGETASTWKLPLQSSDSEHEWSKRYDSKGKGGAFRLNRGERSFPMKPSDATPSGTSEDSNPFSTERE